jgi:cytochrome c
MNAREPASSTDTAIAGVNRVTPSTARKAAAAASVPLLLLAATASFAVEPGQERGRALAQRMCAACHAVGRSGRSPHVGAPAFRQLDRRVDLDLFIARLREGLMAGHPDMPMFRFTRDDGRAFVMYLRSVQTP